MELIPFGKTGLKVSRIAFGGIPIQRISKSEAVSVVRGAIDLGVNFIDTANAYSDSEEKIGEAIKGMSREKLVLASKSAAPDKKTFCEHLNLCLERFGTDYVDIYQLHNVSTKEVKDKIFAPGGAFEALTEAVKAGKVRFAAFTSHHIPIALEMMKTGLFASVQLPFNFIDDTAREEAIPLAEKLGMGFICMKPFGGGLLDDAGTVIRYLLQFRSIVPDPGIEKLAEMREIVSIVEENKPFSADDEKIAGEIKQRTKGSWCHRCDYCQPCPQGIPISGVLTLDSFIKRMPFIKANSMVAPGVEKARTCVECAVCVGRCPYNLQIPELLKEKITVWDKYAAEMGRQ